jgi:diguanylate cyclase (GGDEF)-like protein
MIFTIPITGWIYTKRRRILAEKAANNDLLTGLYSRRAYDEDLDQNLWHSPKDYAVVAMDANGLKRVNDHLGHRAGDEMLKGVASCIQETMHHFNMPGKAYRIGGDEFVIILETQKKDFKTFYQNLLSRIASWHGQLVDHITVSSGYVFSSDDPTLSVRELIAKADELMYHEKQELIRDEDPLPNREDSEVYKCLVQMYKTHLDPKPQLPGAMYFYHIEDEIRKEVEAGGAQLAILAIKIAHVSDDITYCFIRMFGKENLSHFEGCYYVMTSDVQLKVRIKELYKNLSSLEKIHRLICQLVCM